MQFSELKIKRKNTVAKENLMENIFNNAPSNLYHFTEFKFKIEPNTGFFFTGRFFGFRSLFWI